MTQNTDQKISPIRITLLGTGTIRTQKARACSAILIESTNLTFLVDCGTGSWLRLLEIQKDLNKIDCIFITHFHPDHISDLVPILFSRYHASPQSLHPVRIYGASGLIHHINLLSTAYGDWLENDMFQYEELQNPIFKISDFTVSWLPLYHTPESVGYRLEENQKIICISGDSGYCAELVKLCNQANIAILECSLPDDKPDEYHLTPSVAGRIAEQANVKKLVLTHFYPEVLRKNIQFTVSQHFSGRLHIAEDGDLIFL